MNKNSEGTFITVAMAEILLSQNQMSKAAKMIKLLHKRNPFDARVEALKERLAKKKDTDEQIQKQVGATGKDRLELHLFPDNITVLFELTNNSLDIAKREVRYSGKAILRLFTAAPGPRGVRTTLKDFELEYNCASFKIAGLPKYAVYACSAGFLGHSGLYIPMIRAVPVSSFKKD